MKAKKNKVGISDSTLNAKFRDAVLTLHSGRCFFCGASVENTIIDVHHIIKRKNLTLRWDWRNGVPACRMRSKRVPRARGRSCHEFAETPEGILLLHNVYDFEYLNFHGAGTIKDYLLETGETMKEFKERRNRELTEIIKENKKLIFTRPTLAEEDADRGSEDTSKLILGG